MASWLRLKSKTAIVTGAASGIGASVTRALLQEGCRVVMADVNEERLLEQQQQLQQQQQQQQQCHQQSSSSALIPITCNVADQDQVQELFAQVPLPSSILVNCAGITRDGWIGNMTLDQWQQVQDVNLTGTFLCCRAFLEINNNNNNIISNNDMSEAASIINVASVVGAAQGNLGQVNYAASKAGVLGLTRALAKEVAHRNIRVNCVLPGFIDTDMTQAVPAQVQEQITKRIALRKFGKPQDVADLILFLASERSSYITGEGIQCSGMISL